MDTILFENREYILYLLFVVEVDRVADFEKLRRLYQQKSGEPIFELWKQLNQSCTTVKIELFQSENATILKEDFWYRHLGSIGAHWTNQDSC